MILVVNLCISVESHRPACLQTASLFAFFILMHKVFVKYGHGLCLCTCVSVCVLTEEDAGGDAEDEHALRQ